MKKEIKITLVILGICLLFVGIVSGVVVGLNHKNRNETESDNITIGNISNLDDFYNSEIVGNYEDIRTLSESYSKEQAQIDNCFVIGAMVHNDYLYSEFMDKYNKKEDAFIRVVQSTVEGDIFIIDLLYDSKEDKIYIVKDDTRDKFATQEDRTIKYKVYEKTGEWKYQNSLYWIVYNGKLLDGVNYEFTINSDQLFIIATIN